MTPNETFLIQCRDAALAAGHPFPEYAAAEAALESAWGHSQLATDANNLFGQKQTPKPGIATLSLPTREFLQGKWVTVPANWAVYPTLEACFAARIALLKRLAPGYAHYANALKASTGEAFVIEVSKSWSTDPQRAGKVLSTHDAHASIFTAKDVAQT